MSYRTYINGFQLFGNNEYYPDWIRYVKSKGIKVNSDGQYKGELDNFMEAMAVIEKITLVLEEERRDNNSTSLFDLSKIYDDVINANPDEKHDGLFSKLYDCINYGYLFLPYMFYRACEDMIDYDFKHPTQFRAYKLKQGMKIQISAG